MKTPLWLKELDAILRAMPGDLHGLRSKALLLIGFAGALRRSELVGIDIEHLTWNPDGLVILIPYSKTDQTGDGRTVAIPFGSHPARCPIRNLRKWLAAAAITEGPIFRAISPDQRSVLPRRIGVKRVALTIKNAVRGLGLDPRQYSGHSLRAGFCTQAASRGATAFQISRQRGHKSMDMVMRYVRLGDGLRDNAVTTLGL